jgi:hypothetical protein
VVFIQPQTARMRFAWPGSFYNLRSTSVGVQESASFSPRVRRAGI